MTLIFHRNTAVGSLKRKLLLFDGVFSSSFVFLIQFQM